jgi:hypothetical protein
VNARHALAGRLRDIVGIVNKDRHPLVAGSVRVDRSTTLPRRLDLNECRLKCHEAPSDPFCPLRQFYRCDIGNFRMDVFAKKSGGNISAFGAGSERKVQIRR